MFNASEIVDVAIVGAGAAGLATAIFTGRRAPGLSIVAMDGAKKLGAKPLVSGGGRCNITNCAVTTGVRGPSFSENRNSYTHDQTSLSPVERWNRWMAWSAGEFS